MKVGSKFKSIPPELRKNSEMIRHLFYDVIAQQFDRNLDTACDAINAKLQALDDKREYDHNINPRSLHKVILDVHFISYAHLNALAKYYDIPISVMLFFTRVRDELEDPKKRKSGRAENIISAFRAAIDHIEAVAKKANASSDDIFSFLGHEGFREYIEVYQKSLEPSQLHLPDV